MSIDVWGTYITPENYKEAEKKGVCKSTIESRIQRGWNVKDAINIPVKNRTSEEFKQFRGLAMSNGIMEKTFRGRLRLGWSLEDAACSPLVSQEEKTARSHRARKRVIPESCIKEAKKNGVCYRTLLSRLRSGVPMSEAISIPPSEWPHPWKKDECDRRKLIKQKYSSRSEGA